MGYQKDSSISFGRLIASIMVDPERILHVGDPDMDMLRSVMYSMSEAEVHVANVSGNIPDGTTDIGNLIDMDESDKYDVVIIPIASSCFSTAIYLSTESILREGGIVVIHGDFTQMPSRRNLIIEMIREGTMSSFSFSSFSESRGLMVFVLSNNVLARSL
jgi:hypothetical protein